MSDNYSILHNLTLFIFIILVTYIFIRDDIHYSYKFIALAILFFYLISTSHNLCNCPDHFTIDDSNNLPIITSKQDRINNLNSHRGSLGRFLVKCHSCGRKGIIEKNQEMSNSHIQPIAYDQNNYSLIGLDCTFNQSEPTMSFYNSEYNEIKQTYCYNCLNKQNIKKLISNYDDFPAVNGPPIVNNPPTILFSNSQ